MKALIIGYGSIGHRHARLLAERAEVAVVSSQKVSDYPAFGSLEEGLARFAPDYVVVANVTAAHGESLDRLKKHDFKGRVLVEKPLFMHAAQDASPYPFSVHVAYQLRFHKVVLALKEALRGLEPLSAHFYVGQHLDLWRPGRETKSTYSAHKAEGGGVLRDLSHELDMVGHLFGPIGKWHGMVARAGEVTQDSEDTAAFVMQCRRCPIVSLQMNCLDRVPRREWLINTKDISFKADLIQGSLTINEETARIAFERDDAYRALHEAVLRGASEACTFEEGLALVKMIDKVAL